MTKDEKRALAITLRDAALIVVGRVGTWESASSVQIRSARVGSFSIAYRTPFQRMPSADDDLKYYAAAHGLPPPQSLPYGLDIWSPKKVLCIEWDDRGAVELVSLKRGDWQAELIAAAYTADASGVG